MKIPKYILALVAVVTISVPLHADITGSTITGSTATFGGSAVDLDSDGITINAGSGSTSRIKWDDGSSIWSVSDILGLYADASVLLDTGDGAPVTLSASSWRPVTDTLVDLGTSSIRWGHGYIRGITLTDNSPIILDNANFKGGNQFLCVDTSGTVFASATPCS